MDGGGQTIRRQVVAVQSTTALKKARCQRGGTAPSKGAAKHGPEANEPAPGQMEGQAVVLKGGPPTPAVGLCTRRARSRSGKHKGLRTRVAKPMIGEA